MQALKAPWVVWLSLRWWRKLAYWCWFRDQYWIWIWVKSFWVRRWICIRLEWSIEVPKEIHICRWDSWNWNPSVLWLEKCFRSWFYKLCERPGSLWSLLHYGFHKCYGISFETQIRKRCWAALSLILIELQLSYRRLWRWMASFPCLLRRKRISCRWKMCSI